ncbi:MAG TPA: DUF2252 domain-containing protein, partial [Flavitalea sp.]|nr:DUF2252 domain-containing protein [Flavitalea sp.]
MYKEKYSIGKEMRSKTPRTAHATWQCPTNRLEVKEMIESSNHDRLSQLVPVRHFRMSASPFTFYRATASIMARDLSSTPSSGIIVQICGDCHLMNFGGFATPERHLVMDINDFDETFPGSWEWDLKRLAVSFSLAAREKNFSKSDGNDFVMELISAYQSSLNEFSSMKLLDLWYLKFDLEEIVSELKNEQLMERLSKTLAKGHNQTQDSVFYKMTSSELGKFSIKEDPPLILHPFNLDEYMKMIETFFDQYKTTLQSDRKFLLEQYRISDVALKVVGVGSVGTRCFVVLLLNDNNEPLFIQVKEARPSVLAPYGKEIVYQHQGERIVQGQRLIQSASDIFLGWTTGPHGRHYYLRQLRDKKVSPNIETMNKYILKVYAQYCG